MRSCVFLSINFILLFTGFAFILWAGIQYLSAYEVVETQCQHVKHVLLPGVNIFHGHSIVCWNLIGFPQYPPTENGPVTWCSSSIVKTSRNYDEIFAYMKEYFPITSPPTYFPCYHAKNDHRYMFNQIPDTKTWKRNLNIGSFLIFCSTIALLTYYFSLYMDCCNKILTPTTPLTTPTTTTTTTTTTSSSTTLTTSNKIKVL